jgi:DNA-binding NtrC family response regulator
MKKQTAAVIAEDRFQREALRQMMLGLGFKVNESAFVDQLIQSPQYNAPDLITLVSSLKKPDNGLEAAREIRRHDQQTPIILITRSGTKELANEVRKIGGMDCLKLPFSMDDLTAVINRSLSFSDSESMNHFEPADSGESQERMVGRSSSINKITSSLNKIAATDCTVLITGETGTGKELAAKFIHQHSPRAQQPLVVINCAAIPDTLLESELFGHERGAFTGAVTKQEGGILSANHGTVFFDEIGDMSPYAQAKILRTIENKEIRPVGGKTNIPIDVRFVAATNRNLEELIKEGKFRADLYFRFNVARVILPPLRERKADIVLLLDHFRKIFNRQFGKQVEGLTEEALTVLMNYDWPGNIRELKNLLESTFIYANRKIAFEDFPEAFRRHLQETEGLHQDERTRLLAALLETNWNKTMAAQKLHWSRMTLYRKMAKYGVDPASSGTEQSFASIRQGNDFLH